MMLKQNGDTRFLYTWVRSCVSNFFFAPQADTLFVTESQGSTELLRISFGLTGFAAFMEVSVLWTAVH